MPFAPKQLTMADADTVLSQGLSAIAGGDAEIGLGSLQHFDSSAVAALLAWQRAAHDAGKTLHVAHLPPELASLARLYGVDQLLPR